MIAAEMIQSVLEGLPGGRVITRLYKGCSINRAIYAVFILFLPNNVELNTKTFLFDYRNNKSQNNRTTEVRLSSITLIFVRFRSIGYRGTVHETD